MRLRLKRRAPAPPDLGRCFLARPIALSDYEAPVPLKGLPRRWALLAAGVDAGRVAAAAREI
eukprot:704230-Alexandrium_andersonii.AAC.1